MDQDEKNIYKNSISSKSNLLDLFPFKLCVICRLGIYGITLKNKITQRQEALLTSN